MTQTVAADGDGVHEQIITAVAAIEQVDPIDLPPLFDAIDPDALEALFASTGIGGDRIGTIEFPYAGHTVSVVFEDSVVVTVD
ncbi:hypothetical protein OB905_01305 [Halobacteria archaeon AArc-dxtr1]|nr:hypothetical protein [Halobacteria archaeon AArc-dxtr1]